MTADDREAAAVEASERQAEAMEEIVDQLRIQNAVLLEQAETLQRLTALNFTGHPEDAVTGRALVGNVEDHALELSENVDLDAVDMWGEVDR